MAVRHFELEAGVGNYWRSDGVHLNDIGLDLWMLAIQEGVERAMAVALYGCTLRDNGTVLASLSHHLDGKPFMSLNMESARFIAETPDAQKIAQRFNFNESELQEIRKMFVNTCIPHITELLSLGNCTFSRKEAPVVKVTHVPVDNGTFVVRCRAYGHYPKDISIFWYKNGEQMSSEMMERTTLPLLDLTYLTSLSFNVTSMADDVYTCRVNHSSMLRDFAQDWNSLSTN
ncbi:unnamed protein product [Ranitomeya imitator]|uniref:Ig-like domain-containing protein n=1 Tax=Ranitomeya imitator TaxID=111125 RepID=A0ABN9MGI9_9NEOB|nr:unnamed protein product [Ranitomeya imitator]